MSKTLIREYYTWLEKIIQHGGTRNETADNGTFHADNSDNTELLQ